MRKGQAARPDYSWSEETSPPTVDRGVSWIWKFKVPGSKLKEKGGLVHIEL
jgi:hypothetical protein